MIANTMKHTALTRTLVRVIIALLMALFLFQVAATFLSTHLLLGITVEQQPDKLHITAVLPQSPAQRAGFLPGSVVTEVNGRPVRNGDDLVAALRAGGDHASVTLEKNGRKLAYEVQLGTEPRYHLLFLNFLVLMVYISLGIMALRARQLDHRLTLFAAFCLVVALDIATEGNYQYFPGLPDNVAILEQILAALQFSLAIHLLSLTPTPAPWMHSRYRTLSLGVIYGVNLVIYLFVTAVRFGLLQVPAGVENFILSLFRFNLFYIAWGLTALGVLMTQYQRNPQRRNRGQLHFIIAGVAPWVAFQLATPVLWGTPSFHVFWYPVVDTVTHMLFPVAILVAIFRYNLLDLSDFASHAAIRRFLPLVLLAFITIVLVSAILWFWPAPHSDGAIWLIAVLCLGTGLLYQPLQRLVTGTLERSRTREGRDLGKNLRLLSRKLHQVSDCAQMEQLLSRELADTLKCKFVRLDIDDDAPKPTRYRHYLKDEGPLLLAASPLELRARPDVQEVELFLPLQHERRYLGTLLVGQNRSGHLYTPREVELLGLFADNVAIRLATFRLQQQLEHDELTGLLRRENILGQVKKATREYLSDHHPFSIAMLDLDNFKAINDEHGHLFGDQVLRQVGALVRKSLPASAVAGRFGGEEFLILFPGESRHEQLRALEQLRKRIRALRLSATLEAPEISISIGLADVTEVGHTQGGLRMTMRRLIALADERLYRAKKQGKDRCVA